MYPILSPKSQWEFLSQASTTQSSSVYFLFLIVLNCVLSYIMLLYMFFQITCIPDNDPILDIISFFAYTLAKSKLYENLLSRNFRKSDIIVPKLCKLRIECKTNFNFNTTKKCTSSAINCVFFCSRLLNQYPSVVSVLVQKNKTGKRSLRNSSPAQTVAIVVCGFLFAF